MLRADIHDTADVLLKTMKDSLSNYALQKSLDDTASALRTKIHGDSAALAGKIHSDSVIQIRTVTGRETV